MAEVRWDPLLYVLDSVVYYLKAFQIRKKKAKIVLQVSLKVEREVCSPVIVQKIWQIVQHT